MSNNVTVYGDISQRTAAWASREYLRHAEPVIVLQKLGQTKPLPTNTADTAKFRRAVPFAVSTVPLQEGVTPNAQSISYVDVTVQVRQYGKVTVISDWVQDTAEDPVLQHATELMGENAGATAEQIVYNAVKGGTNVVYANGAARTDVNTVISLNKQRAVTRALAAQKARMISKVLAGSPDYDTHPVEPAFVAVAHTDMESDIRNLAGFISTAKYGTKSMISDREIGSVENVRYILSPDLAPIADAGGAAGGTKLSTTGTSADIYPVLFFGTDAFGVVPLKGKNSLTPVVVNAKPSDSDPLAQRSKVGYKFAMAATILNEAWMCRLECAATLL